MSDNIEVKTAGGLLERGHALQRHFVREAETLDGVRVSISHSAGTVRVATDDDAVGRVLDLADEYPVTAEISFQGYAGGSFGRYSTGEIGLTIQF